jgi:hypothetical protein
MIKVLAFLIVAIGLGLFAFVSFTPKMSDASLRCQRYAEGIVPVGLGTDRYMEVWRECMAYNAAR